jgi:hypothetical protein
MTTPRTYVFNGDADGLCALQQLRLAARAEGDVADEILVTGVKRDIALLDRVEGHAGHECVVLDISLDVNREALARLLEAGVRIRYFDHHFAGEVPRDARLEAHLDPSPALCTSLLVDRCLEGRFRSWAVVGAFGDSLVDEARALAESAGFSVAATETMKHLGIAINYNAYGESLDDLHVPPAALAREMLGYPDPLDFATRSAAFRRVSDGFCEDLEQARRLEPARSTPGAFLFVLPDAPWARRASGTLANDLAKAHPESAVAILSPKREGGYLVSLRVPRESPTSADGFCRKFPTGGGRRTAAGINHLPSEQVAEFTASFEAQFRAGC